MKKKNILGLFLFFLLFSPVLCLFSCFLFFIFLFFFMSSFLIFLIFFIFFFHFPPRKSFFFSFFFYFFQFFLNCWREYQSLTVSSEVGAPWRCGVLTT